MKGALLGGVVWLGLQGICFSAAQPLDTGTKLRGNADKAAPGNPPLPVPRPRDLTPELPAGSTPGPSPEPEATKPTPPPELPREQERSDCLARLEAMAVEATPVAIGPQPNDQCTVAEAVQLTGLRVGTNARVRFPDQPTIACATADTFGAYVRELLFPLVKGSYGVALDAVWTGPGLECRTRNHIPGAKLSAHGQGLAIDIAQLRLADQRMIEVGRPRDELDRSFEGAARAGACGYFHTALGPGADTFHETHWHFDIIQRGARGDSKFCQ